MNIKDKKRINEKIKNIKDKKLYIQIYDILKTDENFKPSFNNNGIFFNLNLLDDITLIKINYLLNNDIQIDEKEELTYTSYYIESYEDKLHKKLLNLNLF